MRVIFACAGSGGHINPAIAIANIILKKKPESQFLFIGAKEGLENKLVKNAGFQIVHIRTGKIIRSFTFKNVKAVLNTYQGIGDAKKIISEFKPDLVIGTGGAICGPVMLAAKQKKVPYILHESNAFPGMTVKMLAKNAAKVMIGFEDARARLKNRNNVVYTGTPAKFDANWMQALDKKSCKKKLQLPENKKIVFVTCGSQGAMKVNQVIIDLVEQFPNPNRFVILVTGDLNYDAILQYKKQVEQRIGKSLENIRIEKFVFNMDEMYKVADVCVTRAGAMTITELALAGVASILIPLPTAAENHQLYNAKVLENIQAANIIEQKDLDATSLNTCLSTMLSDDILEKMGKKASGIVNSQVEENIYKCIIECIKK